MIAFQNMYIYSEFLDVQVTLSGGNLSTDLFVKLTDMHQYLHASSCHVFHSKKAIPYSQALRLLIAFALIMRLLIKGAISWKNGF